MKTKKVNRLSVATVILLFAISFNIRAQSERPTPERQEKIKSYKIAFLTERLNLTSKEAEKFWPVYNANEKVIREKNREFRKAHNFSPEEVEDMTESDAQQFIADQLNHDQEMLDLKKKFVSDLKGVIPEKKILILLEAEKQFRVDLMKRLASERKRRGGPPLPYERR